MATITSAYIENMVITNGGPQTLIVNADDFLTIYGVYKNVDRDDDGMFIMVLKTKVRPASPEGGVKAKVDVSAGTVLGASNAKV